MPHTEISPRFNSPAYSCAVAALVYAMFLTARLAVHDWDFSFFVTAGDVFTNPERAPAELHVLRHQPGHDGQFYYRLALDPFTDKVTDFGITLDLPAYRHQRLLYPLTVHALSLGGKMLVPFWMACVNYLALCAIAWHGSRLMQAHGLHALWGLALAGYPGFVLTLARDFNEVLAAALVLYALCLVHRKQDLAAALVLCLGVLARETSVLAAVAIAIAAVAGRLGGKTKPYAFVYYAIPIAVGVGWQLYLRYNWGHFAVSDTGTMGLPFVSFAQSLWDKMDFSTGQQTAAFFQMLLVAGFAVAVAVAFRKSRAHDYEKLAWLLYLALACIVSGNVWSEDWSFLRNLWELYAFGGIILAASTSRMRAPLFACWGVLWMFELVLRTDLHKVW